MKFIWRGLLLYTVLSLLVGLAYPLGVTLAARMLFPRQSGGTLVIRDSRIAGSELLAQAFSDPKYFWPRPSAANYETVPSGASNLGPTSAALQTAVRDRAAKLRAAHGLPANAPVPQEMIFASASGLDPHISPEGALWQLARVSRAREWPPEQEQRCRELIARLTEPPQVGFLGQARVNVLLLNLALSELK